MKIYADPAFQLIVFIWCRIGEHTLRPLETLALCLGFNANYESINQIAGRLSSADARQLWQDNVSTTPPNCLLFDLPELPIKEKKMRHHLSLDDRLPSAFEYWHISPAFFCLSMLLARVDGMSTVHVTQLWRALGVQIDHRELVELLSDVTLEDARERWLSEISPKPGNCLSKTRVKPPQVPATNSIEHLRRYTTELSYRLLFRRLLDSDLTDCKRKLSEKRGNARQIEVPCSLDLIDVLLMLFVYRFLEGDDEPLIGRSEKLHMCRFKDEKDYSFDNVAFRLHHENSHYMYLNRHASNSPARTKELARIDDTVDLQIYTQELLGERLLIPKNRGGQYPDFHVLYCDQSTIIIADRMRDHQSPALEHGHDVIESLRKSHRLSNHRVFCEKSPGRYVEFDHTPRGLRRTFKVKKTDSRRLAELLKVRSFSPASEVRTHGC